MKFKSIIITSIFSLILFACASTKNDTNDKLYTTTNWELEYISGPRIAFSGLYPNKKPVITFNKESMTVTGNNSCNGYSAGFSTSGSSISFGEAGPTTMMFCGEGEKVFMNMIQKIDKYKIDQDGKLNLMVGDVPMMRFKDANK
ncbi:META domain-containing protein [Flavobacterium algicola]|uniref:META domain-containing protein n=1 Tax=Flavobacterium algicola TaxID=556529 RepID=UPI001EFD8F37|nr:META domain-containing protein [Flavobacterium algicola]MCG9792441.1 META domain-containing protein [Flavobacterium algicola]